jgi:ATP-dependent DNA helicase RecQ
MIAAYAGGVTILAQRLTEARSRLHGCFGFQDFRPLQRRVVQSVLAGRDTLAVLPTGAGKSICFQVPALVLGGLTVVVSPLVALMQDQVASLQGRGVAADSLNSLQPAAQRDAVMAALRSRTLHLLYVSPERVPRLAVELGRMGIRPSLLAVDEAHCITEWGHDFRPSYRRLAEVRRALGSPATVALTGSATPEVRQDVIASLGLVRPDVHLGSFDRPNLWLGVQSLRRREERLPLLLGELNRRRGLAIVYVLTRNSADALAQRLGFAGHRSAAYHAGLPRERRAEVLQRFIGGALDVVVATSAFGMGIDAPRVRLVVHWGLPSTPEAYYQEAGRAGRDGQPATCLLLHHPGDPQIHRRQLDVTFPPRKVLEEIWRHPERRTRHPAAVVASAERLAAELEPARHPPDWRRIRRRRGAALERLAIMRRYVGRGRCRRGALLSYFGEPMRRCEQCDVCARGKRLRLWW